MKKDEFIKLNIAFSLPKEVCDEAVKVSQNIHQLSPALFILDNKTLFPHITIYLAEFPQKNFSKIIRAVSNVVMNQKPFTLSFKSFKTEYGYINITLEKTETLRSIHENIVRNINTFREGHLREKYRASSLFLNQFSDKERSYIIQYGFPYLMDLYRPHLTVSYFEDHKIAEKISKKLSWENKTCTVDKISIYTVGEHGTCIGVVKEIPLQ
jgi:2'-5' RNA ligase